MKLNSLFVFISMLSLCYGHWRFRSLIPNGYNVPNPCTASLKTDIWARVGHEEQSWKAGVISNKTKFGEDFLAAKKTSEKRGTGDDGIWPILCNMNSDGDTMTNGFELGDPDCKWVRSKNNGSFDKSPADLFHPGIPENVDRSLSADTKALYCPNSN